MQGGQQRRDDGLVAAGQVVAAARRQLQLVDQHLRQALVGQSGGRGDAPFGEVAEYGFEQGTQYQRARLRGQPVAQAGVDVGRVKHDILADIAVVQGLGRYPHGVLGRRQVALARHHDFHHARGAIRELAPRMALVIELLVRVIIVEAKVHGVGQGVGNGGEMLVAGHGVFVRFFASIVRHALYPWNRTMRKCWSLNSGVTCMKAKHYLFPVIAVLIWAINTIVSKMAVGVIDPAAISFYRWLLAGVLLALVFARPVWKQRSVVKPYLGKLFVLGMLGMVMYQCLAYIAAQTTTATNMGILASMMPLLAVGLSVLFGDAATVGGVVGGILSLLGLSYLLSQGQPAMLLSHGLVLGDGLMLLASLAYAAYSVLLKRWAIPLAKWHSLVVQIWCVIPVLFVYYLS